MADPMQGVMSASITATSVPTELVAQPAPLNPAAVPNATTLAPAPSAPPVVSETLYIQNLNERIKLNGKYFPRHSWSPSPDLFVLS